MGEKFKRNWKRVTGVRPDATTKTGDIIRSPEPTNASGIGSIPVADLTAMASGEALIYDGIEFGPGAVGGGGGGGDSAEVFSGYNTIGTIGGFTATSLPVGAETVKTAGFAHSVTVDNSEVTANFTGNIELSAHVTIVDVGGSTVSVSIQVDAGGGFVAVSGTELTEAPGFGLTYSMTVHPVIIPVTSGDKFRVRIEESLAQFQIDLIAGKSGFTLKEVL